MKFPFVRRKYFAIVISDLMTVIEKNLKLTIDNEELNERLTELELSTERFTFLSNFFDECRKQGKEIPQDIWDEFCQLHRDFHRETPPLGFESQMNPKVAEELSKALKERQEKNERILKLIGKDISKMTHDSMKEIVETEKCTESLLKSAKELTEWMGQDKKTHYEKENIARTNELALNLKISSINLEKVFKTTITTDGK